MHLPRKDMPTMAGGGLHTKRLSKVFWWVDWNLKTGVGILFK